MRLILGSWLGLGSFLASLHDDLLKLLRVLRDELNKSRDYVVNGRSALCELSEKGLQGSWILPD